MKPNNCHGCLALTGGKGFPFVCQCGGSIDHIRKPPDFSRVEPVPSGDCPNPRTAAELAEEMGMEHSDLVAVTRGWPAVNRRRGFLIDREVRGTISVKEADELERLQRLADLRTDLLDPFDVEALKPGPTSYSGNRGAALARMATRHPVSQAWN